jgi:hypothetical protein
VPLVSLKRNNINTNSNAKNLSHHLNQSNKKNAIIVTPFLEAPKSIPKTLLVKECAASLTIEAAFVFSIMLFVLLSFLSLFRALQVQHITSDALAVAAAHLSLLASNDEDNDSDGLSVMAMASFHKEIVVNDLPMKYISGGRLGFSFDQTNLEGEYVDLNLKYEINLSVMEFGWKRFPVVQRARMKKWNGYHGNKAEQTSNDRWVYTTPTGSVYHIQRECTHLKLSIKNVLSGQIPEGYLACELCGKGGRGSLSIYITEQGNRYHKRLSCSGLKRTIYMKKLSQVKGKGQCKRCGG